MPWNTNLRQQFGRCGGRAAFNEPYLRTEVVVVERTYVRHRLRQQLRLHRYAHHVVIREIAAPPPYVQSQTIILFYWRPDPTRTTRQLIWYWQQYCSKPLTTMRRNNGLMTVIKTYTLWKTTIPRNTLMEIIDRECFPSLR